MKGQEIPLGLTAQQVRRVIAEAAAGASSAEQLPGLVQPKELMSSPLLDDRQVSRSLLFGLVVLISFPADGSERGVKELARELEAPVSTTYRYIYTLFRAGLLEKNPRSHRYRRAHTQT
jgi:hypothetical protein